MKKKTYNIIERTLVRVALAIYPCDKTIRGKNENC